MYTEGLKTNYLHRGDGHHTGQQGAKALPDFAAAVLFLSAVVRKRCRIFAAATRVFTATVRKRCRIFCSNGTVGGNDSIFALSGSGALTRRDTWSTARFDDPEVSRRNFGTTKQFLTEFERVARLVPDLPDKDRCLIFLDNFMEVEQRKLVRGMQGRYDWLKIRENLLVRNFDQIIYRLLKQQKKDRERVHLIADKDKEVYKTLSDMKEMMTNMKEEQLKLQVMMAKARTGKRKGKEPVTEESSSESDGEEEKEPPRKLTKAERKALNQIRGGQGTSRKRGENTKEMETVSGKLAKRIKAKASWLGHRVVEAVVEAAETVADGGNGRTMSANILVDRILESQRDLVTLKEILVVSSKLREEFKQRMTRKKVMTVKLSEIVPPEANWAPPGTKMDWRCVATGLIKVQIGRGEFSALVDDGAEMNIMSEKHEIEAGIPINRNDFGFLVGASGATPFCGTTSGVMVTVGKVKARSYFYILPKVEHEVLLGRSFQCRTENIIFNKHDGTMFVALCDPVCGYYEVVRCANTRPENSRNRLNSESYTFSGSKNLRREKKAMEEEGDPQEFSLTLPEISQAIDFVSTHPGIDPNQFKKETLVVLHCLRIFRNYVLGRRFILRVDSTALAQSLKNYPPSDPTIARWLTYIWMFNFEIERISSTHNRANGSSRVDWDSSTDQAKDSVPVDGFLEREESQLSINSYAYLADAVARHGKTIWNAPSFHHVRPELVMGEPFIEEDPWGERTSEQMMSLALFDEVELIKEPLTIEYGHEQVDKTLRIAGEMSFLVNSLIYEDRLKMMNEEAEGSEIREAFREGEYDGEYRLMKMWLNGELREDEVDPVVRQKSKDFVARAPAAATIDSSSAGQQWGPRVAAIESTTTTTTQRIDRTINLLGEVGQFEAPTTLNNQVTTLRAELGQLKSRSNSSRTYKMPNFNVAKFDDYHKTDPLTWWTAYNTEADVHHVPDDQRLNALYLKLIGDNQAFMNNLALQKACTIATLHTKITWDEFEQLWQTRFMIRNVRKTVMNELYHRNQGTMPTREWLTKWQKFVATPKFNLDLDDLRSEFFSRSCNGLTTALGNKLQYETFDAVISRANILIQTDRRAANESRQLRTAKYKANRDKCKFAQQELEYLGHYVTPQGIRPLADKIQAIVYWSEPLTTTDVHSFMRLAGFYQRFVDSYSKVVALLSRLQSPKVPFEFDDAIQTAFQAWKDAMLRTPTLRIYDPALRTRVTMDASGYGISAILEQHDDGDWHPSEGGGVDEGVKVLGYGGWVKEVELEGVEVLGYGGWVKEVEVEEGAKVLGYGVKVLDYGGWVKEVEVDEGVEVLGYGGWVTEVDVEEGVEVLGYGGSMKEVELGEGVKVLGYGGWVKETEVEEDVEVLDYGGWVKEVEVDEGVKVLGYGGWVKEVQLEEGVERRYWDNGEQGLCGVEVIVDEVMRGFDWEGMVDDCMTAGVVVLVTKVEAVVDEGGGVDSVLVERTVGVGDEVIGVDLEAEDGGRVVAPEVGGGMWW
ncbi:hypothetical protein CBR_g4655 [Chara braunii]|uniref:Peptidase A2 domain-containing protein n=1 Tax=Chara braunii TaxID=69332 RepID=A0A388KIG7_CHABU|nr:hypothetical protein CBR_g4655 [Chara braunii]|eukprot:GBG69826.1 hypothetical protein CBR_g4655 [Chara braunii]